MSSQSRSDLILLKVLYKVWNCKKKSFQTTIVQSVWIKRYLLPLCMKQLDFNNEFKCAKNHDVIYLLARASKKTWGFYLCLLWPLASWLWTWSFSFREHISKHSSVWVKTKTSLHFSSKNVRPWVGAGFGRAQSSLRIQH